MLTAVRFKPLVFYASYAKIKSVKNITLFSVQTARVGRSLDRHLDSAFFLSQEKFTFIWLKDKGFSLEAS